MRDGPDILELVETEPPARDVQLLVAVQPWSRNFLHNFRDLLRRSEMPANEAAFAAFWPDVSVERSLPWARFIQSIAFHILALALIWAGTRFLATQPHAIPRQPFAHNDIVYYQPSEYLPPLDTRRTTVAVARKADPELSTQPIISVPRQADNHSQTIVTPPKIRLQHDVELPNIVAWQQDTPLPIGPAPLVQTAQKSRLAPQMERSVIAPPPEVREDLSKSVRDLPREAQPRNVIEPPPATVTSSVRRVGDLDVARSSVIAPAPQLSLEDQRAIPGRSFAPPSRPARVIAPPPAVASSAGPRGPRNMIALNLHPAVGAPPEHVTGNRAGNFAATPEGHRGASGKASEANSGKKVSTDLPAGLYVGKSPANPSSVAGKPEPKQSNSYSVNPNLIADARPPRLSARMLQPESESKLSEVERAVFGSRKFYSLSLNMPNLNSAGGSWIIRFAAMKADSNSADSYSHAAAANGSAGNLPAEELSAPSATRKVDPAYPLELMRQNVGGTVILYGVIHADGTVGNIRVLQSVDERIDRFAGEAVAKWQFQPATKNGSPVDVEATFWIPFKPPKVASNF